MNRNTTFTPLAQSLRKNQTKAERKLWYEYLSQYPIRFKRQYVIGNYIADFYCFKAQLVIELDGSQHYMPEGVRKDEVRTADLERSGLLVLRFSNTDVLNDLPGVCMKIDEAVRLRVHAFPRGEGGRP